MSEIIENNYKCCFTGYRPSKMSFDIMNTESEDYLKFENALIEEILKVCKNGCRTFYTGMAMGFDIIAAETVLWLKDNYEKPLELVCVLPFSEQKNSLSEYWAKRYDSILEKANKKIIISEKYHIGAYQQRNKYMVDNCDFVLTWYDGKSGGTKNTIDYALKKGRYVFNAFKGENYDFSRQEIIELT